MKVAHDAVKPSVVTIGNQAKLVVSFNGDENMTVFEDEVLSMQQIPGAYRWDIALEYAKRLSHSSNYLEERDVVLFINQASQLNINRDMFSERTRALKANGIGLFDILLNPLGEENGHYLSLVSRPVSEHFVDIRNVEEVTEWSTTVARLLCNS